jgi:DNA-binding winged helix-turn-helix (wHTH) protein
MSTVMIRSVPNSQSDSGVGVRGPRLVNRHHDSASASTKEFPPFRLDLVNQCLWRRRDAEDDERILLTPKAFAVLRYLVEHAGRLVTQDELLGAVWPDTFVQPEVLKYQIADIRSKLGDHPKHPLFIETLPRRGYRFVATVMEGAPAEPVPSGSPARGRLVGRDRELGVLRACLRKALRGQRQLVFITGEPGIGKTALADEFRRQAAAEEPTLRIARGQCVEGYGGTEPYYPMLEALGQLCHGAQGHRVVEILAAQAPTWLVQFPALVKREHRQTLQQEIQGATRERMLREIREVLDTLNSEGPLLFVFEDLQWVDPSTLDLISALARQRTTAKTMWAITKRPVDMVVPEHSLKRLKQDLLIHHLCQEMTLAPLGEADVAEYLGAESAGGRLPEGFAELIHRHSEGNPLFMVAILDHMTERGQISLENGKWSLRVPIEEMDLKVPETVRQMIEAQIEHLTTEEQRALEVASVVGALFSASVVAAATQVDAELTEELFARLSRWSRIVRAAGSQQLADGSISQAFEFVCAMYREVLYCRQAPGRRAKLHLQVAERLETLYAQRLTEAAPELAHHFERGGDWQRATKYQQLAASPGRRFEPRPAAKISHSLDSVVLVVTEPERRRVLLKLLGDSNIVALSADDCENARQVLHTHPRIRLVFADFALPDGGWSDVLNEVILSNLDAVVVVCLRSADPDLWSDVLARGAYSVLAEPYSEESAKLTIWAALGMHQASRKAASIGQVG